ncbi:MAG: hypothetical protein K9G70_06840 [Prolixibacteraceae bacterium]|nr:hypothetical protein [Prolixibacteraceae bacterium]
MAGTCSPEHKIMNLQFHFFHRPIIPVHGKLVVANCGVIAPGVCFANLIPLAEANGNSYEECMLLYLLYFNNQSFDDENLYAAT